MLSKANQLPVPAVAVLNELREPGQRANIEAMSTNVDVEVVKAHFTSPMADFLPPESKQCCVFVVKPPKGESLDFSAECMGCWSRSFPRHWRCSMSLNNFKYHVGYGIIAGLGTLQCPVWCPQLESVVHLTFSLPSHDIAGQRLVV
jgi:hypothetical protein